jgi:hypothetical protein
LRQVLGLIQYYETDDTILALAADKSGLFQKFGQNIDIDKLLRKRLTLTINVGMGATDPIARVNQFLMGMTAIKQIATEAPMGLNLGEVIKEVMSRLGYRDGARFWKTDQTQDPDKMKLMTAIQQLQQMMQQMQQQIDDENADRQVKLMMVENKEQGLDRRQGQELKTRIMEKLLDLKNPVSGEKTPAQAK